MHDNITTIYLLDKAETKQVVFFPFQNVDTIKEWHYKTQMISDNLFRCNLQSNIIYAAEIFKSETLLSNGERGFI